MPVPNNDFTVEKWLEEIAAGATLPPDKKAAVLDALKDDKIQQNLRANVMLRPDYSRAQDQIKRDKEEMQAELAQRRASLAKDFQDLAVWRAKANKEVIAANEAQAQLQTREAKLREALLKVKKEYDVPDTEVDPTLLNSPMTVQPPAPATVARADEGNFITRDDMARIGQVYGSYPVELHDLTVQHEEIFGTKLRLQPLLEKATKLGKPLLDVWREEFNPDQKIREKADAELQAKLAAARLEGLTQGRQEGMRIPGQPPIPGDLPHAPVFSVSDRETPVLTPQADGQQARGDYLTHAAESLMLRRNTSPPPAA